jgi:DNA-binding transcriptional MerR regulator/methylmalonyl-CoA mutase cobalamin-binding subunit
MIDREPRHPIQVVARRTGLSADAIRAWERRYQAVSPQRAASGRRLYTDEDVERLRLLHEATLAGRRISDLVELSQEQLLALVAEDEAARPPERVAPMPRGAKSAREHLEACRLAVEEMNPVALERALAEASVALTVPVLLQEVVAPFMREVGDAWREGKLRVGHEHMTSHVVRSLLAGLLSTANPTGVGPGLLITTPAGQQHEIGALMAAVLAASDGWRVTYLSPDTPAVEIAAAADRRVRAVAVGITYPPDDESLPGELRKLRQMLPEEIAILVGGRGVVGYRAVLDEIGAIQLADFVELRRALEQFRVRAAEASN